MSRSIPALEGTRMEPCRLDEKPVKMLERLGVSFSPDEKMIRTLPFSCGDVTAGSESELQAVVEGDKSAVDLPLFIEGSNYFANIVKRAASGETSRKVVADLERFLSDNPSRVWENSWVRFKRRNLSGFARQVFDHDLLQDKKNPSGGKRADAARFIFNENGEEMLRLPVSYLIKLALADLLGSQPQLHPAIRQTGIRLMGHFLNDNTSPETFSFNVVSLVPKDGMGAAIARETAIRFLMTQLLIMYANIAFGLDGSGQRAMVYFAPHPPVRQKELNDHVADSFYRELFMSPCLSGWDRGEDKFRYMQLCHQVLSRSQLNGVAKLRDAGIIINNLVVLPSVSNVSLANNGTHISIGSRRLTSALSSGSGFGQFHEKHLGDLAIKITEHFLPLFTGSYTAAPFRLAFTDFHPEKALGFLPHELDYTHLRMIWRRWRKKAVISIFGQPVTPFGPKLLDRLLGGIFRLKGDYVPDYRLVDYLVCLLSTESSPALNGVPGNTDRLRQDLADMGVFDEQMSVYLLYKQREFGKMGFSGFEGRHYSLFPEFEEDMGRATDLQTLITALAFKYMALGMDHGFIPDAPQLESERRQIFFASAIGIPTFFVRKDSGNGFLAKILKKTEGVRSSRRYAGYLRVPVQEYRRALLKVIREDGADLIEMMSLHDTLQNLELRLTEPEFFSAAGRLQEGILSVAGCSTPMGADAREFNMAAEQYYRNGLRLQHLKEGLAILSEECLVLDRVAGGGDDGLRRILEHTLGGESGGGFLAAASEDIVKEKGDIQTLRKLMNLILLSVHQQEQGGEGCKRSFADDAAPVHRAG